MLNYQRKQKQKGVTLIISLVLLVSLTMIGITSMQSSRTELAMAGNQRESGLMFYAAEMGLVAAETHIDGTTIGVDIAELNPGHYAIKATDNNYSTPDYYDDSVWDDTSSVKVADAIDELTAENQPRFIIEHLGDRHQNALAGPNIEGYGTQQTGISVSIFRATARGAGLTGKSFRYVQSYVGKEIL